MTLEQLIKKYKNGYFDEGWEDETGRNENIVYYKDTWLGQKFLQDLEQLKETLLKKELEYKNKYQDEKDKYTKIDNAFIDGKIFAIKEIIGG